MMVVGLFATVTLLSSCVENEVAPEVTELRMAQVEMVQAKTAYQNLLNERETIANTLAQSRATFQAAMFDLDLQNATAQLAVTLMQYDAALLQAEANVELAEIQLQQAIDDLAMFLNTAGLEKAAQYLDMYSDEMGDYYGVLYDILGQEVAIASMEALYAQNDYVLIAEIFQRDLDLNTHELSVWEAVLTSLEVVAADPTAVEAEIATALAYLQEVSNDNAALETAQVKDELENVAPAFDAWTEAIGGDSYFDEQEFDGIVPSYLEAMDNVKLFNEEIADWNDELTGYTDDGVILAAILVIDEAALTSAITNYNDKKALSDATLAALRTADANYNDAWIAFEVATDDHDVDNNALVAAQAALTAAENALTAAETDVATAESDLDDAEDDFDAAEIDLQQAKDDKVANEPGLLANVTAEEANVLAAEGTLTAAEAAYAADPTVPNLQAVHNAETALEITEDNLADAEEALAQLDIDIADEQADLTDATNAKTEASLALSAAKTIEANAKAAVTAAEVAFDTEVTNMVTSDATLQTFADPLNAADDAADDAETTNDAAQTVTGDAEDLMDDMQALVDGTNEDIEDNDADIAEVTEDIAGKQEEVAYNTGVMTSLQTAYDAVDLVALEAAYDVAEMANGDLSDAIDANYDIMEAQEYLLDALLGELDSLDEIIGDVESDIDDLKESINDLERALEDNVIDDDEFTAQIAAENEELARLTNLRDAYLKLADEYWALYVAESGS